MEQLATVPFGDSNFDAEVNFSDFLVLSESLGQNAGWANGDFNGNGQVDFPDFLLLSANFGETTLAGQAISVPEPHAMGLLLLGMLFGLPRKPGARRCDTDFAPAEISL